MTPVANGIVSRCPEPRFDHRRPFSWRFTAPMFLGSALNPINSSLIATALVPIAHGVGVSVGQTVVLVSALYLASAIAQPTAGKLSEVFGPRRIFLTGILLVLAGGVLGGVGNNLTTLTIARVLIGVGTSAGYPSAMLMIRRRAESVGLAEPPGGVLGGLQIAAVTTAALGLPIGGVLVSAFGWRSVFLANVPVTLLALALAAAWLPRDPAFEGSRRAREVATRIDLGGILGFGGAMAALLVFINSLPHPRWIALVLAIVLAITLAAWEMRAQPAFFDVRLLAANLPLVRTYLRFALTSLCVYTVFYGVSQWLEAVRAFSAQDTGLLLLPMSALSAIILKPIAQRNLVRGPLIAAAASSIAGAIGVLLLSTSTPTIGILGVTLIFGVTLGTFASSNQTALYIQVDAQQIGTAAGLLRTFGYIGSIASSAIIGIVFRSHVTDRGLHTIAVAMIAASVAGLLLVLADRTLRARRQHLVPADRSRPATHSLSNPTRNGKGDSMPDAPPTLDPRHTALLVMDFQPAVLGSLPDADALLSRVADAIAVVRSHAGHVAYVRVAFEDADYDAVPAHSRMAPALAAAGRTLHSDSPATAVHEQIAPEPDDIVVRKTRISAFSTTDLDQQLRERDISTLILAGITTSGVVLSTVRDAHDRDYQVFVLADATADPEPDTHDFLAEKIFPRQAQMIQIADLHGLFSAQRAAYQS